MTGRFLTCLAVLVVASLSCVARSDARKAGRITYQNLVPGGIAIGGVTSRINGRTSQAGSRETMAQMFEEAILNSREDIPLMGADRVRSAVGPDTYESILEQFDLKGDLSASTLDTLRPALADSVRYFVVARIEKDYENRDTVERDTDYDMKLDKTFNTATRTVVARFMVYDLREGKLAWKFRPIDSETEEAEAPKTSTIFKPNTVAGMLETALSDDKGPDPGMPDAFRNLAGIFRTFEKALPKRKK